MADEKSVVNINKMIHKKTGASFLVVYVIYVSLVYTDSKKTASCLLPQHTVLVDTFKIFEGQLWPKKLVEGVAVPFLPSGLAVN